jgi:hypothetical protein
MDTTRTILMAAMASMLLAAVGGASAQTIYKQVDEEGRVIFTDQPAPGARTITSFETSRSRAQAPVTQSAEPAAIEPLRPTIDGGRPSRAEAQMPTGMVPNATPHVGSEIAQKKATGIAAINSLPSTAAGSRSNFGEAERAVATYTALNTPMAAQADALEAARRARQEASRNTNGGAVLVVQAAPRDQEPAAKKSGLNSFYLLWAVTFFALAAGLLYVGWQVIRLILGTAFPRWQVGLG